MRGENIYKRKDGRYEGRFVRCYRPEGGAVYGSVYARSYTEVREKLFLAKQGKKNSPGSGTTLDRWLTDWVETVGGIRESTRMVYKSYINNQIIPRIGKISLKRLTPDMLGSFVSSLELAPSTVRTVYSVLRAALAEAEGKGCLSDVWTGVKLQKRPKSEVRILSISEQKRLEEVLEAENDIGIFICLYTGLRIGEVCALRWSDVDLVESKLFVNGTQSRVGGGVVITRPKSESSVRVIPLPGFLREKLEKREKSGEFVLSEGGCTDVRTLRRRFKRMLEKAGLPDIRFHSLRHTFATRALEVGMDYKTLSEILGHSSVAITLNLYAHSLDEYKRSQMRKLDQVYRGE